MRTIRIEEEFRGAVLGDRRRAARLERIGLALATVDNTGVVGVTGSHTLAPLPPVATPFGALVVRGEVRQLLTVREVAARLRVSRATVYRLVQAGALPVLRISNSIRIPEAALSP